MLLFTVLFLLIANSLRSSEMSNNLENEKLLSDTNQTEIIITPRASLLIHL